MPACVVRAKAQGGTDGRTGEDVYVCCGIAMVICSKLTYSLLVVGLSQFSCGHFSIRLTF